MTRQVHIAFIINSYNRRRLLEVCLRSLEACINQGANDFVVSVIVYDAGSTDGTLEWLAEHDEDWPFKLIWINGTADPDTSFAAGLNCASERALSGPEKPDYLMFYETDNQIRDAGEISKLIEILQSDQALAACGYTVKKIDGSEAGFGANFPRLWHFLLGPRSVHFFGLEQPKARWENRNGCKFTKTDVVYTSPLLVKSEAWTESGGLDQENFPFSECDVDWAKRLSKLGWEMGVIESIGAIHDNADALSSWSNQRALHFHRGRLRYFEKHYPKRTRLLCPHLLCLRHLCEKLIVTVAIRDPERKAHLSKICSTLIRSCWRRYES